jgi:hypothetical protein
VDDKYNEEWFQCFYININYYCIHRHHRDNVQVVRYPRIYEGYTDSSIAMLATGSKDGTIGIWNLFEDSVKMKANQDSTVNATL